MTNKEISEAVEIFRKSAFWKSLYDKATDGAKKYLAASFVIAEREEEPSEADLEYVKAVVSKLSDEDREWLAKNLPNPQARAMFAKK